MLKNTSVLYKALSKLNYTFYDTIFELIDNSIDAGATKIKLSIKNDGIFIVDNGSGMSKEVLSDSLKLGKSHKEFSESLGKFGMGLKTSTLALGRNLQIQTKRENENPTSCYIDYDEIIESGFDAKRLWDMDESEAFSFLSLLNPLESDSGTIIIIKGINTDYWGDMNAYNAHKYRKIQETYEHFLDRIEIYVDEKLVTKPEGSNHSERKVIEYSGLKMLLTYNPNATSLSSGERYFRVYRDSRIVAKTDLGLLNAGRMFYGFKGDLFYGSEADDLFGTKFTKKDLRISDAGLVEKILEAMKPYFTQKAIQQYGYESTYKAKKRKSVVQMVQGKTLNLSIPKVKSKGLLGLIESNSTDEFTLDGEFKLNVELKVLEEKVLYEAELSNEILNIYINKEHPYYKYVMKPASERQVTVKGLDFRIYSKILAECIYIKNNPRVKKEVERLRAIYFDSLYSLTEQALA